MPQLALAAATAATEIVRSPGALIPPRTAAEVGGFR